jgi:alpha-galactosidase
VLPEFAGNIIAVETAPFWPEELAAIDNKHEKVRQMDHFLRSKHKDHANQDDTLTDERQKEYFKKYEAEVMRKHC